MWYLTSDNEERVIFISPPTGKVTIGRIADPMNNVSFPEDNSISRKHATLVLRDGKLKLIDLDSKYGTFLYENKESTQTVKLTNNVETALSNGNKVRFGVLNCIWNVHELNFVTCASTVKGENLVILKSYLEKIGGTFKTDWDETCSFLTMPAITVTIKVVLALAQGAHIVTLDFWKDCSEALANKKVPPKPEDYLPAVIETTLNQDVVSFLPNIIRKKIFAGKKFVFFSKRQWELYNPVLKMCSGVGLLLGEQKLTKSMLCAKDVIVIQYTVANTTQESQTQQNQINGIVTFLKGKGKRLVAEAEIGLAVLYCSAQKYCNPEFNFSSEVIKQNTETDKAKLANILAPESQDSNKTDGGVKDNVLINETLTPNKQAMDITTSAKRKINDTEIGDENPHKKFAPGDTPSKNGNESELFDFIEQQTNNGNDKEATENRLNFAKPQKRKSDFDTNTEEDLFNFVPMKKEKIDDEYDTNKTSVFDTSNKPDVAVKEEKPLFETRGMSIKELVESTAASWKSSDMIVIDDDMPNELEERMGELRLGITIVTVNKNLVRERTDSFAVVDQETGGKNFKKFKKVWPIKMHVTVIPKSRMSVVKPDASAIGYLPGDSDTDDEVIPVESVQRFKRHAVKVEKF